MLDQYREIIHTPKLRNMSLTVFHVSSDLAICNLGHWCINCVNRSTICIHQVLTSISFTLSWNMESGHDPFKEINFIDNYQLEVVDPDSWYFMESVLEVRVWFNEQEKVSFGNRTGEIRFDARMYTSQSSIFPVMSGRCPVFLGLTRLLSRGHSVLLKDTTPDTNESQTI